MMFDKSYFRSRGMQSISSGFSVVMVNVKNVLIGKIVFWLFGKFTTYEIFFSKMFIVGYELLVCYLII